MKKWIAVLLVLAMCLSLAACGGEKAADESAQDNEETSGFETMVLKYGCSGAEQTTWVAAGRLFGDLVSEATDGAVTVEIFSNDQLYGGNQVEGIQGVIDGTTDVDMHSNLIYASFDDRFSAVSLPFLFATNEDAYAVLDGKGGEALSEILEEMGLHVLGIGENGFRHVTNSKREITCPEDMITPPPTGLKFTPACRPAPLTVRKTRCLPLMPAVWLKCRITSLTGLVPMIAPSSSSIKPCMIP